MTSHSDPSGRLAALEAHEAGAVTAPSEQPTHAVTITFRVHGTHDYARTVADELTQASVFCRGVDRATFTVEEQ